MYLYHYYKIESYIILIYAFSIHLRVTGNAMHIIRTEKILFQRLRKDLPPKNTKTNKFPAESRKSNRRNILEST